MVDPDARFVDGKTYAAVVEGGTVVARRIFEAGPLLKMVIGDGTVIEFAKSRVNVIGRVRWSYREH